MTAVVKEDTLHNAVFSVVTNVISVRGKVGHLGYNRWTQRKTTTGMNQITNQTVQEINDLDTNWKWWDKCPSK